MELLTCDGCEDEYKLSWKLEGIFKKRMKRIDSSCKLIGFLSARRSSTDVVANVATVEFRSGVVVLIKRMVFNVVSKEIGAAESHFGTHDRTIDFFYDNIRE